MLTDRENWLRNVRRTGPEWIPMAVGLSAPEIHMYGKEVEDVMLRHPLFFPHVKEGDYKKWVPAELSGRHRTMTDAWGCTWEYAYDGHEGQVLGHPLDDWAKFDRYQLPDPSQIDDGGNKVDWEGYRNYVAAERKNGRLTCGGFYHGFFVMRLWYLRGFENLMIDIATGEPKLQQLIDRMVGHYVYRVEQMVRAGVDQICYADDLGTQTASILSPAQFHKWITPAYKKMIAPARQAGVIINTHTDGHIIELVDELLDCGCDILNPQDLCNGIDNIARTMKGRCCINLDIDRQSIIPFGTRNDIHGLIEEEVEKLGSPEGGLEFICGIYPPTPPENVDALCEALEKHRTYWWD
ncbi:MAG: hypothetical protein NTU88_12715 [Armatimonadetes bacterium]|nr:hypothetical protein [Armatimonadota bacterium]